MAIIISGIVQAIFGGLQLFEYLPSNNSGFKMTGGYFNPGPYAGFLASVWPIALGIYLFKAKLVAYFQLPSSDHKKLLNKHIGHVMEYIPAICMITIILILPITQSRAAWSALITSSVLLLEYRYGFLKLFFGKMTLLKKNSLKILTVVVLGVVIYGAYILKKGSSDGRLFIWKIAKNIILDNPIYGVGIDRFNAHYMNYQALYFLENGETKEAFVADNTYYAFNELMQFTLEEGLIGLLFLFIFLAMLINIKVVKERSSLLKSALAGLVSITVFANFSYPTQILPIKLITIVLLALIAGLDINKWVYSINLKRKKYHLNFGKVVFFTVLSFGIIKGGLYIYTVKQSFMDWKAATTAYQYGNFDIAMEKFEKGYPVLKNEGDFLMNYGKALSLDARHEKAIVILKEAQKHLNTTVIETGLGDSYKALKKYDKAENAYEHAQNMIPVRFYPLYLLVLLYEESGQNEKAKALAQDILDKDIKVPSTAINEIKEEMQVIVTKNLQIHED